MKYLLTILATLQLSCQCNHKLDTKTMILDVCIQGLCTPCKINSTTWTRCATTDSLGTESAYLKVIDGEPMMWGHKKDK